MGHSFTTWLVALATALCLAGSTALARAEGAAAGPVVGAFFEHCTAGIDNPDAKAAELVAKGWTEQPADSVPALRKMIQMDGALEGYGHHRLFARTQGADTVYIVLARKPDPEGGDASSCDLVATTARHEANLAVWQQHIKSAPSEQMDVPGDAMAMIYQPVKEYPDLTGIGYTFIHPGGEVEKLLGVAGLVMGAETKAAAPQQP